MSDIRLIERLPCTQDAPGAARVAAADVLARLHARGCMDGRGDDLALIVSELVTNAVIHGPPGDVELRMIATPSVIRVEVEDSGTIPFDWPAAGSDGHWGLALVATFSERAGLIRGPPTVVWCELDLI
ncbi:MAG TPA: ATP-binding protein [Thermoleophilaceae bacterium]